MLALLACACAGRVQRAPTTTTPAIPAASASPLPEGWDTCGARGFTARITAWQASAPNTIAPDASARLHEALSARDALAVRAVLLLAHTDGGHMDLIEHLEARVEATARSLDASDIVAAAALMGESREQIPARLTALALPGQPHPDLEVRVECARSALPSGRREVIPFLLTVLRVGTHDEHLDPPDWNASPTQAWVKSRAAEALSREAGVPVEFRPDGSFEHQEQEARRLARLVSATD